MQTLVSPQIRPFLAPKPFRPQRRTTIFPLPPLSLKPQLQQPHTNHRRNPTLLRARPSPPQTKPSTDADGSDDADGIPAGDVKTLVKFKSRYNYIRVLEVSRRADHSFAGSRLLLLDSPGNIHSISFMFKFLTTTYFDVFATLPPILPPGPIGILGFGAGSAARLIFHLFPDVEIHGWELDPSVVAVGREYFGLVKLEKQNPGKLLVYVGDALEAEVKGGFAGVLVDLFSKGSVIPELQEVGTWERLRRKIRKGGRVMVNCGGSCVEAEEEGRDGEAVMEKTLRAMAAAFKDELRVLNLGRKREDSCLALTGKSPDGVAWKQSLPPALRGYVDMWSPYDG